MSAESAQTPILIEMRDLEKSRTLDELVAQHLARSGMERIDLEAFRYMLKEGRIALLFDGFDELALRVTYDRAAEHFATLAEAASGEAKVVVTSRTTHFESERQVKTALGEKVEQLAGRRVAHLRPFDAGQIRAFLVRSLGGEAAADARFAVIDQVKDLLGLSHNPRMLSFIADLREQDLLAANESAGEITSAELYRLILERWLEYEYERQQPRGALPALSVDERWEGGVVSVAFSPDGKALASGSFDNTVRIWEVATGRCLVILGHLPEGWVAFTPEGRYKLGGEIAGGFWHSINLCRFEPGELDPYLQEPLRMADDEAFF